MTEMNDNLVLDDFQKQPLPTGLNVLTILSIIGCVLQFLLATWGFISSKANYEQKDAVLEKLNSGSLPSWAKSMMPDPERYSELMTKSYENRIPILLLGLIAIGLCFVGVLQMRKRKKQGFMLYTIGELLPFLTSAIFLGAFTLTGGTAYFGYAIAALFILMYAGQRKYLTK